MKPCKSPFGPPRKPGLPTTRFRLDLHRPMFYRYRVAYPGLRVAFNRYPGCVIGWGAVVGRYCYAVKWGSPGVVVPGDDAAPTPDQKNSSAAGGDRA